MANISTKFGGQRRRDYTLFLAKSIFLVAFLVQVSAMGKRPGVLVFQVLRDHLNLGIGWTGSAEDGKPFRGIYYYVF